MSDERADIVETLGKSRHLLRHATRELTDTDAAKRTTVSELTLGGLIKHVAGVEEQWANFILEGPSAMGGGFRPDPEEWHNTFRMLDGETLAQLLARYDDVARRTDALAQTVDLDAEQPLPEAPWFPLGAKWSARRVFLHIATETAQHAGHADIIRESLDGARSMG